ncbi:MAG: hypothetical protein ACFFDK_15375 [Promethearchaeota archaeon]
MNKIKIKCPSCSKGGIIEISDEEIKNSNRGILTVNVAKDNICDHSFLVYIDKNLRIRDYFLLDFRLELPDLPIDDSDSIEELQLLEKELNFDLIKINLPALLLAYLIKSIISKQKIVLILNEQFFHEHIHNFLRYITHNSFEFDITILTQEEYKTKKDDYKNAMVFDHIKIVRNANKLIKPNKLEVEKYIINKFLTQVELGFTNIVLKNEIFKAYRLSESIVNLLKDYQEKNENINMLMIKKQLESEYNFKINRSYLDFLIEIVKNYFKVDAPSYSDSFMKSL